MERKNGENLKILIEIFRQDVILSEISLAWNLKFTSSANHGGDQYRPLPLFKISGSAPIGVVREIKLENYLP